MTIPMESDDSDSMEDKPMIDISTIDYGILDRPEIKMFIFHPRPEVEIWGMKPNGTSVMIPVDTGVDVGGTFHMAEKSACNVLFFHGNGEIVADYNDLGEIYNKEGINFLPVDYRGYGRSGGSPGMTSMIRDCHMIFEFIHAWLENNGYTGPLVVMGRSLGSASALELAAHYPDRMDALVIESGFAWAGPLLSLLGVNLDYIGFKEENGFRHIDKIRKFKKPARIIHAEFDQIIPFSDGQDLFDACGSADKQLIKIAGANHNDIFFRGLTEYIGTMKSLAQRCVDLKGNQT